MALPIFADVTAEERASLSEKINCYPGGRKAFAEKVGEGYMTVSHRLNAVSSNRLPVCVADYYWQVLGAKAPKRG